MKSRFSLLPIAALAACLWTSSVMAQAGAIPADMGTHGTTGDRLGPRDRSDAVQPASGTVLDSAAALRQRALVAMESLREEIATLAALKDAQAALLAWNRLAWDRGRMEGGEAPVFLASALCAEPALDAWCPLLPATFGNPSPTAEESHDRD